MYMLSGLTAWALRFHWCPFSISSRRHSRKFGYSAQKTNAAAGGWCVETWRGLCVNKWAKYLSAYLLPLLSNTRSFCPQSLPIESWLVLLLCVSLTHSPLIFRPCCVIGVGGTPIIFWLIMKWTCEMKKESLLKCKTRNTKCMQSRPIRPHFGNILKLPRFGL